MQLTCPECRRLCTFDEQNAENVLCPSCGRVVYSRSSTPPRRTPAETPKDDEETRRWEVSAAEPALDSTTFPVEFGRYRIECELGHGGAGRVYRATDAILGRTVALKIPKAAAFVSEERIERFLSEARNAARLRHPCIVTIFDVGELRPKLYYIAMEYVAGRSLHERMAHERLAPQDGAALVAKLADAVHYAHGQGQVHRDLKPSNVLLDEHDEPRVVDFGLAVHEDAQARLKGQIAGTPAYMAPEQFRGEAHYLDGRCDIWSLGVILYQMLTGRRPFRGEMDDLCDQVLHRDPKPPRQINDQVSPDLEAICLKCLAKSPGDRYTTARDLAEALRRWNEKAADRHSTQQAAPAKLLAAAVTPPATPLRPLRTGGIAAAVVLAAGALLFALSPFAPWRQPGEKLPPIGPEGQVGLIGRAPAQPLLEAQGKPLSWLTLLRQEPHLLAWGGDSEIAKWTYDPDRQEIKVYSPDIGFFGLGETRSNDFRLQAVLSRDNWEGHCGLFWGYLESKDNEQPVARCEALSITAPEPSANQVSLVRRRYEFLWVKGILKPQVRRDAGVADEISDRPSAEIQLEIAVTDGWLSDVQFQRVKLDKLHDQPLIDPPRRPGSLTWVGVFHDGGVTTFREARVKLLHSKTILPKEPP